MNRVSNIRILSRKDTATLEEICASGLLESCRARISARESNELIHWMKLSNRSRPRIVSDRAVRIPIPDAPEDQLPSVLRQVVVRLHTRQYLIRGFWEGRNLMCDAASKDVVEYVVLQKRIWKGEEESWRIWGMTKETDLKRLAQKSAASKLVNRTKAAKA
ncbi:hypothetical protein K490DRAFT_35116 [Saccharata proteae CBS 121410]|uniref:Tim44-like domain-containing protein n=1 Tax=Saccharata proteae CBS 121410 TaxID=1314787 RepID=A0A9P4LWV8_9PEZI|nr:hypothetical protein K490DRAFT_35116 [Saccharata proteae CBS 121410]